MSGEKELPSFHSAYNVLLVDSKVIFWLFWGVYLDLSHVKYLEFCFLSDSFSFFEYTVDKAATSLSSLMNNGKQFRGRGNKGEAAAITDFHQNTHRLNKVIMDIGNQDIWIVELKLNRKCCPSRQWKERDEEGKLVLP